MGISTSKRSPCEKDFSVLIEKIKYLQKEINEMIQMKKREREDYQREGMAIGFMREEWKKERKKLKKEVKRLRNALEEKEERIRELEEGIVGGYSENEWELIMGNIFLVEQLKEENAQRDEAMEKWKQLYLEIKHELDHLIQTTNGVDVKYWRVEDEEMMEFLKKELKSKEETIGAMKAKLDAMEQQEVNSKREIDILRQSLRIMGNNKKAKHVPITLQNFSFVTQRKTRKV